MSENILKLKNGRNIRFGVYGSPDGIPVLDFHGIPGSCREAALIHSYISRPDLRMIGFDRPGYGCSSPVRNFQIRGAQLPADVEALADHLNISRFIALGYSGGAPFALACAAKIPDRISALGIVSGVGPALGSQGMHESNRKKFNLAQKFPWLARMMLWAAFSSLRIHPDKNHLAGQLKNIWQQMPEPDRFVLEQYPAFAAGIVEITRDAIKNRVTGWVNEEILMTQPWQLEINQNRCANIFLWHGEQDRNVPVSMARELALQLPNCHAKYYPAVGHLSLLYNHGQEILDTLLKAASGHQPADTQK